MSPPLRHAEVRQASSARFRRLAVDAPVLIVVRAGEKTAEVDGHVLRAGPGQAVALSGGVVADIANAATGGRDYGAEVYALAPGLAGARPRGDLPAHGVVTVAPGLEDCLARCRAIGGPGLPPALARHTAAELLLWVEAGGVALRAPAEPSLAAAVRAIVAADPAAPWDTDRVLARLSASGRAMSAPTLRRRLAQEGAALSDLLADVRMSLALDLLQTTARPVTAIALDVGYASPSRFAARFRARFEVSPSAIRERMPDERSGTPIDRFGVAGAPAI